MSESSPDNHHSIASSLRHSIFLLVLLFLTSLFTRFASAEATVITENTEELNLINVAKYLEDKDSQYTVDELNQSENDDLFMPIENDVLNLGISESVVWIRFDLRYLSYVGEELGTWLIEVAHPTLDLVTFYVQDDWDGFQELHAGDKFPFSIRLVEYSRLLFPVDIRSGETLRFYIRVETSGSLYVPLKLWAPLAYIEQSTGVDTIKGAMLGALLVLLIYNLLVLLRIRILAYLYFIIHAVTFLLYFLSVSGLGLQYLWPEFPEISAAAPVFVSASVTFLIVFAIAFLRLEQCATDLNRYLTMLLLISVFLLPVAMLMTYGQATWLVIWQMLLVLPSLTMSALYIWLVKKDQSVRFFFAACLCLLVGGSSYTLMLLLEYSGHPLFADVIPASGVIAMTFLSLGLASRIRRQKDEWILTEVHSREELEKVSHRLVEGSRLKGEFLSAVSHELEQPVRFIARNIDLMEEPDSDEQKQLLNSIRQSALGVDELITYLNSLTAGQNDNDRLNEVPFNVQRQLDILIGGISVQDVYGQLANFSYNISEEIPEILYADTDKLFRAFRYAAENMVKRGTHTVIDINVQRYRHNNPEMVGLTFRLQGDFGDLDESELKSPAGLWWPVCRQLMHVLGGTVHYTAEPSGQVSFEFSLGCREVSSAS